MKTLGFKIDDKRYIRLKHRTVDLDTNVKGYVTYLIKKDLEQPKQNEKE